MASIGIPPGMPPGPLGVTAGVALGPAAGNAEPTWLNAGAAEAQLCGTESIPSEAARPRPAVTAALPIPGVPKTPVAEPRPLPSVNPNAGSWVPKALAVGLTDCMSGLAKPIAEMPEVDIDAAEPAPDTRLVPDVSAADDEVRVVADDNNDVDDESDIDEPVKASPDTAVGVATVVSGADSAELSGVDIVVISGATV